MQNSLLTLVQVHNFICTCTMLILVEPKIYEFYSTLYKKGVQYPVKDGFFVGRNYYNFCAIKKYAFPQCTTWTVSSC